MKQRHGWFVIPGIQTGDRTIEQQIKGLDHIDFRGKTVLELASAEGLMSKWMTQRGAKSVTGVDVVAEHVKEAWKQTWGTSCAFQVLDLNDTRQLFPSFDIVMALAILHKLKKPDLQARRFAHCCKEMVIRLPPENAPLVIDARSDNVPYDIDKILRGEGFDQVRVTEGHLNEWTAHYVRAV